MNNRGQFLIAVVICLGLSNIAIADYNVRGKGRLVYRDGGTKKPLPRVRVQLMDSDIDLDVVLKKKFPNSSCGDESLSLSFSSTPSKATTSKS